MANFSDILYDIVIFIKGRYVYRRLNCDGSNLDDGDKNVAISYFFCLPIHEEVKLRHKRATLCPKYTYNDDVWFLEATEILEAHQGYAIALTCGFLWVSCL
ncbi:hypothetical protein RHMOL_Rhmol06G0065500 [Rhododendron molle]|uniref:Uncharacterized protein n=1 Tax=Rhododendron molle TaxID=49168 RepID=A0ACC0NBR2_RHOML|nr:hypothetical protein RHMOL_Rhmol06G0065500 [Rhododendron molle]